MFTSIKNAVFGKGNTVTTMISDNKGSVITINGNTHQVSGKNIKVVNDKVFVDGKLIEGGLSGVVSIKWDGPAANIDAITIEINGDVQGNVDGTTINIRGNVKGDVDGTTINCGNVGGSVDGVTINRR
jgi:hypothetical protein